MVTDVQRIEIPRAAKLLHVAEQYGALTLWAEVETTAEVGNRLIAVIGTGGTVPTQLTDHGVYYVGTAVGPVYVWHVYDLGDVR
jgi:hypothetical protein